jgi:transcriptional regulator with XRE-family HTH domain
MKYEDFLNQLRQNIRHARWASGLTQEQVAERGISYKHYQEIEGGRKEPTVKTLYRLAGIMGTTVSELLSTPWTVRSNVQPYLFEINPTPPKRGRKPKPRPPV